jgi:serine phosphatase RsbU (regulator of sigma subunit)/tetratricopeptide (TPR) repeat protein
MRIMLLLLFLIGTFSGLIAQQNDRLIGKLESARTRTEKVEALSELADSYREKNPNNVKLYAEEMISLAKGDSSQLAFAWGSYYLGDYFYLTNEFEQSIPHFERALVIFKSSASSKGIGEAASSLANVYFYLDRYKNALNYAESALDAYYKTGNLLKQSNVLTLICDIYTYMERYNQAIQYCVQSMKIKEEIQVEEDKEVTLNTIGLIYQELGTYNKAKEYLNNALEIAKSNGDSYNIATTYSNLGNLYILLEKSDSALMFFNKALEIDSIANDQSGLAYSYFDIGSLYKNQKKFRTALDYLERSQVLAIEQNMPELISRVSIELGDVYINQQEYNQAINELKRALVMAQRINSTNILKDVYQNLSKVYDAVGDKENALIYMRLYLLEAERKYKKDNTKAIAEIETIYKLDKKEQEIDLLKKEKSIEDLKTKQRKFFLYAAAAGILFLLILILILNNRNKLKNRTNKKLQLQNVEIVEQKEEIEAINEKLEEKSKSLANKNEQITDSINYARQIQESLLPAKSLLKEQFPNAFIYYKPKDIVSGDFYWHAEAGDKIALAIIDCTGHGVPGAFMTVLANSLLNQIILETGIHSPDLAISLLDQKIQQTLHQNQLGSASMDGLDIGLLFINKKKKVAEFTGAKIPLYVVKEGELSKVAADRYSVGSSQGLDKVFNKKEVKLEEGSMLYLSTDGYQDQFGGPNDKKFMKKNFYNFLTSISNLPPTEQEHALETQFQQWRGRNAQTDDILVVGIKV